MREFKFRVWDNLINGYSTHLRCNVYEFFDSADGNVQYACVDVGAAFLSPPDGQIIEQFTGLRDKNGREIYEGDIISAILGTQGCGAINRKERPFNFVIHWWKHGFEWSRISPHDRYRFYPSFEKCEVIGNIHENPELLK